MTFKLRHLVVLFFALFLGAVAMYVDIAPWLRVLVAAFLLFPIIYAADGLRIGRVPNALPGRGDAIRHRQFGLLRSEVMQLLDLVRRLNWLAVDLERGDRNKDQVKEEIARAEQRLDEILAEIRNAAGRTTTGIEDAEEWEGYGAQEGEGDEWREGEGAHQGPRE